MLCDRRGGYNRPPTGPIARFLNAKEIDMRKLCGAVALVLFLLATQSTLLAQAASKPLTLTEKPTVLGKLAESKDKVRPRKKPLKKVGAKKKIAPKKAKR